MRKSSRTRAADISDMASKQSWSLKATSDKSGKEWEDDWCDRMAALLLSSEGNQIELSTLGSKVRRPAQCKRKALDVVLDALTPRTTFKRFSVEIRGHGAQPVVSLAVPPPAAGGAAAFVERVYAKPAPGEGAQKKKGSPAPAAATGAQLEDDGAPAAPLSDPSHVSSSPPLCPFSCSFPCLLGRAG